MRTPLSIITLALIIVGCAVPPGPANRQVDRLLSQQQDLAAQIQQLQTTIGNLESKVQQQQGLLEQLQGSQVAQRGTVPREMARIQPSPSGQTAPSPPRVNQTLSPTEIYLKAFSDYASGRFDQAILGFESFLRLYPNNDYAANAQFWLGECYYSKKQYDRAIAEFEKVVNDYPQGAKAPDALWKIAAALKQTDQTWQAEEALRILRQRYPDSPAARKPLNLDSM